MKIMLPSIMLTIVSILATTYAVGQTKSSISIETGYFFKSPAIKIAEQLGADDFGDDRTSIALFGFDAVTTSYPNADRRGLQYWLRYEREVKNNKSLEISFGHINKSTAYGWNSATSTTLTYENILYSFKANYLFYTSDWSAAIGGGPAFVFYRLQPPKYGAATNTETKNYILPGLSVTALIKFINQPRWFLSIRTDESITAAAKIPGFTATRNGKTAQFKGTKAGSFNGSATLGIGIKF